MKILEPVGFKNLKLKNRIAWTPAVTCLATDEGYMTDALIDRHVKRAKDGAGFIQLEACGVLDRKSPKLLRLCEDSAIDGHKKLTDAVHKYDSKVSVQLIHYVKQSVRTGWKQDVADLSCDDIGEIVNQFVAAGERTKKAGYDAIELHAAHGYTLASFISLLNKRTDQYGGNAAGRCKIVVDIIKGTRQVVGEDYCIGARINGDEFVRGGSTIKQAIEVARVLGEAGLDFISISAGGKTEDGPWYTGYSGERTMPTSSYQWGCHTYLAAAVREVVAPMNIPVITAGRIQSLKHGEEILEQNKADIIGYCRPMLCDPEWITKQIENRESEIVRCAYCNVCQDRDRVFEPVNCIVWEAYCKKKGIDPLTPIYKD